jgi:CYTH domain-containing protein
MIATSPPAKSLSRYAHPEREQRWLLDHVPEGVTGPTVIYDRYIIGTRLRLRHANDVYKLGQKIPTAHDTVALTNIYLSRDEYDVFAALPARELRKQRWHLQWQAHDVCIDEFTDRDLILAEVELATDEPYLPLPPFASKDVTGDVAYSGGALAR